MDTKTQHGYLVLADISGYTSFLAKTELEHAHEILSELLNLIVSKFNAVLIFSKFEGDAVFAHVPESNLSRGETLLELVESTYVAFRDHLQTCARRTTCTCNACRAIPTLDLKFMVHHGDYIIQQLANGKELVGSDVNLVHRLMKNHITEETGMRAYAMFSEKSLEHMCIQPDEMHKQIENYEHLGDVPTYSLDLHKRYKELTEARHVFLTPEEATGSTSTDFPVPPAVVWDWLNDPVKRERYNPGTKWSLKPSGGRTGPGAVNHCAHGKNYGEKFIEKIVDWRPFEYFTTQGDMPMGVTFTMTRTHHLTPTPTGTHVVGALKIESPLPGFVNNMMGKMMLKKAMIDVWALLLPILQAEAQNPGEADAHAGHQHELTHAHAH